jgi:hypothetical protein
MSKEDVIKKIEQWIESFVEVPNEDFSGWAPCPYARKARLDGKIGYFVGEDQSSWKEKLLELCESHKSNEYDVSLLVYPSFDQIPTSEIDILFKEIREAQIDEDLWIMYDHPDRLETFKSSKLNQGDYLIFFIQHHSKLTGAMKELEQKGYYENWPEGMLERFKKSRKVD